MRGCSVIVLGTGEAFDGERPNTSLLLRTDRTALLLDCGSLVPPRVWQEASDVGALRGVWISHFHADHAFGIPALLGRMWEEGRTEPLALLGGTGIAEAALKLLEVGYPGLGGRLAFPLEEVPVEPGGAVPWRDLVLESAESSHGLRNLAVRIGVPGGASLVYSGDGALTPASAALAEGAHWVHECFAESDPPPGHADLATLTRELRERRPVRLGLVHVNRRAREHVIAAAAVLARTGLPVEVLEPGARWTL